MIKIMIFIIVIMTRDNIISSLLALEHHELAVFCKDYACHYHREAFCMEPCWLWTGHINIITYEQCALLCNYHDNIVYW